MTHPPSAPLGEDSDPTLGRDLAVLAWLECAPQLSQDTTAHLCSALEEWALLGERCPNEQTPDPDDGDHLQVLTAIAERLAQRAVVADAGRRIGLAMVAREVLRAVACQRRNDRVASPAPHGAAGATTPAPATALPTGHGAP